MLKISRVFLVIITMSLVFVNCLVHKKNDIKVNYLPRDVVTTEKIAKEIGVTLINSKYNVDLNSNSANAHFDKNGSYWDVNISGENCTYCIRIRKHDAEVLTIVENTRIPNQT